MYASLLLGAAVAAPAAPVPKDTNPTPVGPAPLVMYLKADAGGRATITTYAAQKGKITRPVVENNNGKQVVRQVAEEVTQMVPTTVALADLAGKYATADGTVVVPEEVLKRTRDGVVVLVSADGKPVEKGWLRAVGPDAIVLTSDALAKSARPPTTALQAKTQPPRLVLLGTDAGGKVTVTFKPSESLPSRSNLRGVVFINNGNGAQQFILPADDGPGAPTIGTGATTTKPLADIAFEAYDLTGKMVAREEALKRLKAGGLVLVAGDSQLPAPEYLSTFRGDLLVLVSNDLRGIPGGPAAKPGVGGVKVAPAPPAPILLPAQVPGVQLRIAPAIGKPLPAPAKPAAEKEDAPPAKPAEKDAK